MKKPLIVATIASLLLGPIHVLALLRLHTRYRI